MPVGVPGPTGLADPRGLPRPPRGDDPLPPPFPPPPFSPGPAPVAGRGSVVLAAVLFGSVVVVVVGEVTLFMVVGSTSEGIPPNPEKHTRKHNISS